MRIFSALLLIAALLVSAASAEFLTTANPLGQGKMAFMGAALQDSNIGNNSAYGAMTLGAYGCYGLTDKLDLFASLGSMNMSGLPAGLSSSVTALGLNLKYNVIEEGAGLPVSVAVGGGYKMTSYNQSALLGGNVSGSQIVIAGGFSKIIAPFAPYTGLAYKKTTVNGADSSTQLDLSVGTAIAWSMQGAVYVEYTLQQITPAAGANYNGSQIALGVGYRP